MMSTDDKMAPFLASEMAWVCHVIFFYLMLHLQKLFHSVPTDWSLAPLPSNTWTLVKTWVKMVHVRN